MTNIKIELNRPEAKELSSFTASDVVQSKKTECIFMVVDNNKNSSERLLMRLDGQLVGEIISVTRGSMFYKCEATITVKHAI